MKSVALAHSLAIMTAVLYLLCVVLFAISSDLYLALLAPWFHGIDLRQLVVPALPGIDQVLFGLVSMVAVTWIFVYATAELYRRLSEKI